MAPALVSLERAKHQLKLDQYRADLEEQDIQFKIEQASQIIRDYLKSRVDRVVTVTSSSVASPTVITTDEAHGYSNGEIVVIEGHEDSVPSLDGTYEISNVTSTTFTVPVAVTTAGTGGTATVEWNEDTTPYHVQAAVLLMLTHLYEHRGDDMRLDAALWEAVDRLLARSRDPAFA